MSSYHEDLPEKWIEVIEKDEVLKELFEEQVSEDEPVPEFLFQALRGEIDRIKPIFELYGEPGLEVFEKIKEIEALTEDTKQTVMPDGNVAYAGYFYVNAKDDKNLVREIVRDYIRAVNDIYENEFEEDSLMDESAQIEFPTEEESVRIRESIHNAWCAGNPYMPEMDMQESIGDWFIDLDMKEECEELRYILSEPLYHISNDYFLSYYIQWSLMDVPEMENPFLPHYKLWCMGLETCFVEEDKVIIIK